MCRITPVDFNFAKGYLMPSALRPIFLANSFRVISDYVFLNDDGIPYSAGTLRQRLERWCKRAGIPVMPPYALRHVFGTRQGRNGTNQAIGFFGAVGSGA
jgi:integrase